ncbi:flippase [Patescibacteria group bacterium]|nr:flippase [Patescibacteria group bacterium]
MHEAPGTRHPAASVIAGNTLAQLIGKGLNAVATFAIALVIGRTYGVSGYGDFTKITTFVAYFYLLADFGVNAVYLQMMNDPGTRRRDAASFFASLLGLRMVGSVVLLFLAVGLLFLLPRGTTQGYTTTVRFGIILFSPAILFQAIITTTNAVFQQRLRYDAATIAQSFGAAAALILVFLVSRMPVGGLGVIASATALLTGAAVTALIGLYWVHHLGTTVRVSIDPRAMKPLFMASIPLGITLLFNQLYFHIDSFVITLTRSTAEVGIYGIAYKVFELAIVLPTFFMNAVYPLLLETVSAVEKQKRWQRIRGLFFRSFLVLAGLSLAGVFALWAASPFFSAIRPDFAPSTVPLRILSLGLPVFYLSSLCMWTLIALGQQKLLMWLYGCSMLFTVILDVAFIPKHGYPAAAWITVLSEGLVLCASFVLIGRTVRQSQVPDR